MGSVYHSHKPMREKNGYVILKPRTFVILNALLSPAGVDSWILVVADAGNEQRSFMFCFSEGYRMREVIPPCTPSPKASKIFHDPCTHLRSTNLEIDLP
jgi:hypothetical protein